jgi:hypothetical protein
VCHGYIGVTKSPCKANDKIGKFGFGCAFIKGIDNKRQRWTPAQSGLKLPERLEKESLHLVIERLVWI